MQIGILGNAGSWYVADLERAAMAAGHCARRVDFPRLAARCGPPAEPAVSRHREHAWRHNIASGAAESGPTETPSREASALTCADDDLTRFDAVIVRTMPPGSLEQVVYRMDALARLEAAGVTVFNPAKAIECAVDKYLATVRLEAAGLPVPPTIVCEDAETALAGFDELGGDVVVKPIFGSEGRGILRVSDPDLALRTFRTLERLDAVLYIQRYIPHEGCDVRVMVLDGRVLGAMRRCSSSDFRTNVSRAATTLPHDPTDLEAAWALRAAQAVGARFAGVDILYDALSSPQRKQGFCDRSSTGYVIEVNAVPGWRAFSRTTGQDVATVVIAAVTASP